MRAQRRLRQIGVGQIIGHQSAMLALPLGGADHLLDAWEAGQAVLDLTQLDAKAAHLDLGIVTTEELDGAIGQEAPEIAGEIQAGIGRAAERIEHEALDGQIIAIQIAAREHLATDADLADGTLGHRLVRAIKQIETIARQRLTDDAGIGAGLDLAEGGHHGRLGRAIEAHEAGLARPPIGARLIDHIATEAEHPERRQRLARQVLQHHRRHHGVGDPHLAEGLMQGRRFLARVLRYHGQCVTVQQRREDLEHAGIEVHRRDQRHDRALVESHRRGGANGQMHYRMVLDHHALGLPGGARGVDDVSQGLRADPWQIASGRRQILLRIKPVQFAEPDLRERLAAGRISHHIGEPRVIDEEAQPFRRIARVERHIGAAGLEDAEHRRDQRIALAQA